MENTNEEEDMAMTAVPWGKVGLIGVVMFANMFSSSLLTPVAPFMVTEFYPSLKEVSFF